MVRDPSEVGILKHKAVDPNDMPVCSDEELDSLCPSADDEWCDRVLGGEAFAAQPEGGATGLVRGDEKDDRSPSSSSSYYPCDESHNDQQSSSTEV